MSEMWSEPILNPEFVLSCRFAMLDVSGGEELVMVGGMFPEDIGNLVKGVGKWHRLVDIESPQEEVAGMGSGSVTESLMMAFKISRNRQSVASGGEVS